MPPDTRIRVLPDEVINKIAAGEVIERPASVVKELIENAIDAGAVAIDVEVVAGGRLSVVVADSGSGMSRDDAVLCCERHATSKIARVEDIERIGTLGFRGEALAAIASVSRFSLQTRRASDAAGTEVVIHGGRLQDVRDIGAPPGTRLTVKDLFFNVPARRRFLRTDDTELGHVRQWLVTYALSFPGIGFTLRSDGRLVHALRAGATEEERVREILGKELSPLLRIVDWRSDDARVWGCAGLPQTARADRGAQYVFVNGRPTSAPVIQRALSEAYASLLPRDRHPVAVLHVDVAPEDVDVNVHPTKREVRFRRAGTVRDAVMEALRSALGRPAPAPRPDPGMGAPAAAPPPALRIDDLPSLPAFAYPRRLAGLADERAASGAAPASDAGSESSGAPWSWCRVIGVVVGEFVVLETAEGMVLMDPRAARERVLFERLLAAAPDGPPSSQGLLMPETVRVPPRAAAVLRQNVGLLRDMGFGVSEFGGDTFIVDAVPAAVAGLAVADLLAELAADGESESLGRAGARWSRESIARAASRHAAGPRDRLRMDELERLVSELAACEMPYTCPHGRPTLVFMGRSEIRRKFGRS